ncbi:MAG: uracil-DNA glycosylase [Betaproteobacteria bacterium]
MAGDVQLSLLGRTAAFPVAVPLVREPYGGASDLAALAQAIENCHGCRLRMGATRVVPGEGNPQARLMLVGEGPGQQEDLTGRPFVGAAGQLLERMLAAIGLSREDTYIANVVKCRPPGNRVPADDEAAACLPYVLTQIQLVNPEVVLLLGATATRALVGKSLAITKVRGQWFERDGRLYLPTYHPAALLRDPSKKREAWEDLKQVRDYLGLPT